MMNALFALALVGCSTPPQVTSVDPAEALVGSELKILGEAFPADATVWLVQGDDEVQVADATFRGAVLIEGTVPAELASGAWTVQVRGGGSVAALPDALTVLAPEPEVPCSGAFKANTQLSLARELVVIDRFYEDGERETLRIPIPEIERLEYELVALEGKPAEGEAADEPPAQALCSVIYMKRSDGRRVVFDDDTRLNLEPRAYKLGNRMKKPTVTTRKDVEKDPRPVEEN